jgi:ribosome recycling factor
MDVQLIENDPKPFQAAMEKEMLKGIKHFEGELIKIRTGRAHTSLVEDIQVVCYGNTVPLKQVAALAAPDVRLITIQPWDATTLEAIEKALLTSEVGVKPQSDGAVIKLVLPEMSSTRREELIKILGKKLEECRVAVRNVRRDFNNLIRDAKKDKVISENFFTRLGDILQKVTDKFIEQAEQLAAKKEKEIRSF